MAEIDSSPFLVKSENLVETSVTNLERQTPPSSTTSFRFVVERLQRSQVYLSRHAREPSLHALHSLDERVSERVLYDILIQAGRVVDLFIPKDKETERPKGFAFAEYETEEIADYAVKLFSGVVTLYNRPLKFGISGQDKAPQSQTTPINPTSNTPHRPRPRIISTNNTDISQHSTRISLSSRSSAFPDNYSQEPPPPGVTYHSNEHGLHSNSNDYRYSRRAFGTALDGINSTRSRSYDTSNPVLYPSYN